MDLCHNNEMMMYVFSNNSCKDHCVNYKETKDFVDTNLCAPECATEISTPRDTFNFIVRNFPGKKI